MILILLIERVVVTIFKLDHLTEQGASRWAEDYQQAFCGRFLAWEQNWEASFEWLMEYDWLETNWLDAVSLAQQEKLNMESYWDQDYLASCKAIEDRYELYYQQNPNIRHPYPNWAVRYLSDFWGQQ